MGKNIPDIVRSLSQGCDRGEPARSLAFWKDWHMGAGGGGGEEPGEEESKMMQGSDRAQLWTPSEGIRNVARASCPWNNLHRGPKGLPLPSLGEQDNS